jgi:hypothetical protein
MREARVEQRLVKGVKTAGGSTRKVVWPGHRGAPDRLVFWPRRRMIHWIELKRPETPAVEAHQKREHQKLKDCGQIVIVLPSIEAVDEYVNVQAEWEQAFA